MDNLLRFEDLQVGAQWRSQGRTVTETDIVNFATQTGDFDPLHVDHEYASQGPFRRPIAHGLLGLAWVAGLARHYPLVETVAFVAIREWEFVRPVYAGDTVTVINEVADLRATGRRRGHVIWRRQLVNQSGQVVQQGMLETIVARRTTRPVAAHPAEATLAGPHSTASTDSEQLPSSAYETH